MKDIGKILFPEQYAPAGKDIAIDNSAKALELFERTYPKGGIVLLGHMKLASLRTPYLLVWMYLTADKECPKLVATMPVCKPDNISKLNKLTVLDIMPCENEIFFVFKNRLYSSVFTTKSEIAIMKIRSLLCSKEAAQGISMLSDKTVSEIYPVDLYSLSEHKFIGICWAVIIEEDDNLIFWYPVCFDEEKRISSYDVDNLDAHPVNIGEDAVIGGNWYKLHYSDDLGYFFKKKLQPSSELQKHFKKAILQRIESNKKDS